MLQVFNLAAQSGILVGTDELAADLLRLFGITDKRLIQRTCSYELLSSVAGTSLKLNAWREGTYFKETLFYELTLPGKERIEIANEIVKLFGLGDFRGITRVQLKIEVGRLADLTVYFEPRKSVETLGNLEHTFTAKEIGHAKIA